MQYLRNSTKVEDRLVLDAGQVLNDVRNVCQSIHDQFIHTCDSILPLLWCRQVLQFLCILAPHLAQSHNHISIVTASTCLTDYIHTPV